MFTELEEEKKKIIERIIPPLEFPFVNEDGKELKLVFSFPGSSFFTDYRFVKMGSWTKEEGCNTQEKKFFSLNIVAFTTIFEHFGTLGITNTEFGITPKGELVFGQFETDSKTLLTYVKTLMKLRPEDTVIMGIRSYCYRNKENGFFYHLKEEGGRLVVIPDILSVGVVIV